MEVAEIKETLSPDEKIEISNRMNSAPRKLTKEEVDTRKREIAAERKEISDELGALLMDELDLLMDFSTDPEDRKRKSEELARNKARQQELGKRDKVLESEERRLDTRSMFLQMVQNRKNTEAWLNSTIATARRNAERSQRELNAALRRMGMAPLSEKNNNNNKKNTSKNTKATGKARGATRFCSSIADCFRRFTKKNTNKDKKKGGKRSVTRRN